MKYVRDKYEPVLGFVTIIISLSAFKDELRSIKVSFGYFEFSGAQYFLWSVIGFGFCMYLYVIERIFRDTRIGRYQVFEWMTWFAYYLFVFLLMMPFVVCVFFGAVQLFRLAPIKSLEKFLDVAGTLSSVLSSLVSGLIAGVLTHYLRKSLKKEKTLMIEEQEVRELDAAGKLLNDGHHSMSILESFKAIMTHLYKRLIEKQVRVSPHRTNDLIALALKHEIINGEDAKNIDIIREKRNAAAHTAAVHTRDEANWSMEVVRQLIRRD